MQAVRWTCRHDALAKRYVKFRASRAFKPLLFTKMFMDFSTAKLYLDYSSSLSGETVESLLSNELNRL